MKVLGVFLGIMIMCGVAFAETTSYTQNASPCTTYVDSTTAYRNITFPYKSRQLVVINADSGDGVWVDLKSVTNTSDTGPCVLIAPGDMISLTDFGTDGISLIQNTTYSGGDGIASPISVIATY